MSSHNMSSLNTSSHNMSLLNSTRIRSSRGIGAGALLALALSAVTGASPQTLPANQQVTAPKQVGAWTVTGWKQDYCAAERPARGADGGASDLQFVLIRMRSGYRIALSAPEWELTPQSAFPVELIVGAAFRSESKAVAVSPKLVIIELGTDRQLANKIAAAPTMEIKAAQVTFKLPMEGFGDALGEVEACFGTLTLPAANPFTGPKPATEQAGSASAAPEAPAEVTTVTPAGKPPAAVPAEPNDELI